ncbi:MAG: hypothetical protein QOC94_4257 [Actinoplanes sp.]|jgi:hypothetical protein|nr:hypothetical protein [Actinoplanes sp.]
MESALQTVWTSVPQAAVIWITLVLAVAVAAAALALPGRPALPGRLAVIREAVHHPAAAAPADDGSHYAEEITEVVDRAAANAAKRRAEWAQAQTGVDAAWTAYDQADDAARRAIAASAYPLLSRRRGKGETADRERYLHHAATAACRRRELSVGQLNDALAHRGWDARKHPVAQEVTLRVAVREHRFASYRDAAARERRAWRLAESAAAALQGLRSEAVTAKIHSGEPAPSAANLWWAEQWETTQPLPAVPV